MSLVGALSAGPALRRFAASAVITLCAAAVDAETVPWLYDVEVPVASQSARDRGPASRRAFEILLTRVTGLKSVPRNEEVRHALSDPGRYYVEYRFSARDEEEAGEVVRQTYLVVSFDPASVQRLIRDAALPVWSANRPRIAAWIVVDRGGGERDIVANDADLELVAALRRQALARGVHLELPLMDLTDQLEVSPATIEGGFTDLLFSASRRYGADYLLHGRVTQRLTGGWTGFWTLSHPGGGQPFSFEAADESSLAAHVVDAVADDLMQRFAVFGLDSGTLQIAVSGASSIAGYGNLLGYLAALEFVDNVDVVSVSARAIELRVHTRSSEERLAELLANEGLLVRDDRGVFDQRGGVYRWRGPG